SARAARLARQVVPRRVHQVLAGRAISAGRDVNERLATVEGWHADLEGIDGRSDLDRRAEAGAAVRGLLDEDLAIAGGRPEREDIAEGIGLDVRADGRARRLRSADLERRTPRAPRPGATVHEGRITVVPDRVDVVLERR